MADDRSHNPLAGRRIARWLVLAVLLPAGVLRAAEPATRPAPTTRAASPRLVTPVDPKQVQSAIDGALAWLAANQIKDGPNAGSWPGDQYQTAVASLAGLAFLANGHRPGEGEYGRVIDRAMAYVQSSMTADGYLGTRGNSMYVHAICTLFGLSYLGASPDPSGDKALADWCRKSLDVILEAQKVAKAPRDAGGWRYFPFSTDSDLSVTSWQLLVLHSARQCGYAIDDAAFDAAMRFVNASFVEEPDGSAGFVYRSGISKAPEPGVTGAAVFVKSLVEKEPDHRIARSLAYLQGFAPSWGGEQYKGYFFFVTFYMAQGMLQTNDDAWKQYSTGVKRVLVEHQAGDGQWPLPPENRTESRAAGPGYSTAMGVLILSLDKQYLPMYQRQKGLYR